MNESYCGCSNEDRDDSLDGKCDCISVGVYPRVDVELGRRGEQD